VAVARPLSELPRFLTAVAVQSKDAAAAASNAGALHLVRAIRTELPTRRLNRGAVLGRKASSVPGALSMASYGKQTGRGVNYGYLEAEASKAKYQPTAVVVGRGPVHLLENDIGPHKITQGVVRGPDGRIRDLVEIGRGTRGGLRVRRGAAGPTLADVGFRGGTRTLTHPGVKRSTGPFRRGVIRAGPTAMVKWQSVFANESLRVKGW